MNAVYDNQENAMETDSYPESPTSEFILGMCSSSEMQFQSRHLRQRPDVVSVYQTPGMFKFRRRLSMEPRVDYLARFPVQDCMFQKIFSYLNKRDLCSVMRTCKRFWSLAQGCEQWKAVDMGGRTVADEGLISVINRGVRALRLADAKMDVRYVVSDERRLARMPQVCKLVYLDLSRSTFQEGMISAILTRTRYLKCLSLEGQSLADPSLDRAIGMNVYLTHLDMSMTSGISQNLAASVCAGCTRLEELNVSWCGLDANAVSVFCRDLPITLKKLNMSGTSYKKAIEARNIIDLVHCYNLTELDLSDNEYINEDALSLIVNRLPRLYTLSLNRCFGISPIKFLMCGNIAQLNVHGCTTEQGQITLSEELQNTQVNRVLFNYTAKPSVLQNSTKIWNQKVSDYYK